MTAPRAFPLSAAALVLAGALCVAGPAEAAGQDDLGDVMLTESFPAPAGGTVTVSIADGNVELLTGTGDRVDVTIHLKSRRMDRARERYEEMDFRAHAESDGVVITSDEHTQWFSGWNDTGGFQVTVVVRLPERYDVEVETSDGAVRASRIEGGEIVVHTSDGDIDLGDASGSVRAETSDGDIFVRIVRLEDTRIETDSGDIEITADPQLAAEVELRGDSVRLARAADLDGRVTRRHASGTLNGGGPRLAAYAGDGEVSLHLRDAR
jgi:hypothetical protein